MAAFYYAYKDQQIQVYLNPSVGSATFDAGSSRVWGIETDTVIVLSPRDRFNVTFNYLNAKLSRFEGITIPTLANPTIPGTPAITGNLNGNAPPQAPRLTIAVGYDHTFNLGASKVIASAYSRFKSDYFLTPFNYRADQVDAFTATDLSLQWVSPGETFSIQGYVRNIENNRIKTLAGFNGGGINSYAFQFAAPRTYGVQGSLKF